ncbi:MAG TPA: hypothetical protein VD837_06355 [Terriglobales bacterium]|nr:hypothetical protein [Terriglobales bacterium]
MKIATTILLLIVTSPLFAQTEAVELTVVHTNTLTGGDFDHHLTAIFPKGEEPHTGESRKIRLYPRPVPFELRGVQGKLTWFSYTNPPEDSSVIYTEADQPTFGSFLLRDHLYVCSWRSIQSSVPVMNALLSSVTSEPLTEPEVRSIALLFAKCSDTLQIFGDEKPSFSSAEAQKQMEKIATPVVSELRDGNICVVVLFMGTTAHPPLKGEGCGTPSVVRCETVRHPPCGAQVCVKPELTR